MMMMMMSWSHVTRKAEPMVEKWVTTPGTVLLIRGNRRVGKSTTVVAVLEKEKIPYIKVLVDPKEDVTLENLQRILQLTQPILVNQVGLVLVDHIKMGKTIVLKEIQNCSTSFQISLQEGIDHLSQMMLLNPSEWSQAGSLVLMGSLPGLVDAMVNSRKNPLYQRITASVSIQPFDTQELTTVFRRYNLLDHPELLLTLKTVLGSMPFRYHGAFVRGLLDPSVSRLAILKEFVASELQQESSDARTLYETSFGLEVSLALKAVKTQKTKNQQVTKLSKDLGIHNTEAFNILHRDLFFRYGFITPEYSLKDSKTTIQRFVIADPLLLLAQQFLLDEGINGLDLGRAADVSDDLEKLSVLEEMNLERWIREIVEDRYMLTPEVPLLPHPDFQFHSPCRPIVETKLYWDCEKTELDFIVSLPGEKIVLVGSCKRLVSSIDHKRLVESWKDLNDAYSLEGLFERLEIENLSDWDVKFLHFAAIGTLEVLEQKRSQLPTGSYVFTLMDLLTDL